MTGALFGADAPIRRVFGHPAVMLGGGRALLLQLAHPAVARGVAEHSDFASDPFGRLQRTLDAVNAIVYGTAEEAAATAAAVRAVHGRVHGEGYDATDPALLGWVHATLVDTAMAMHAQWVRPLAGPLAAAFYADAVVLGEVFGVPRDRQPADVASFDDYVRDTLDALAPRIGDDQRVLARAVLHPRVPTIADPIVALGRQLTVGQLPAAVRRGYGFGWDLPREAALRATTLASRVALAQLRLALRALPARGVAGPGVSGPGAPAGGTAAAGDAPAGATGVAA